MSAPACFSTTDANALSMSRSLPAVSILSCNPSVFAASRTAVTRRSAAAKLGFTSTAIGWLSEAVRAAALDALLPTRGQEKAHARHVATWSVEAINETEPDRIVAGHKHDRNSWTRGLGSECRPNSHQLQRSR